MKKWIAYILTLALALAAVPAMAAGGTLVYGGGDDYGVQYATYLNGTTYIYGNRGTITTVDADGKMVEREWADNIMTGDNGVSRNIYAMVNDGETVYALVVESKYDEEEESSRVKGAALYPISIDADGKVVPGEKRKLDWDDMVESSDDYEYSRECNAAFIQDGQMIFTTYNYSGGSTLFVMDIEEGDARQIPVENLVMALPYKDGKVLVEQYDYNGDGQPLVLSALDIKSEETTHLLDMPLVNYNMPTGLVYDAARDALYYALNGEIWVMPGFDAEKATSVASVQGYVNNNSQGVLTDENHVQYTSYDSVIRYSTDPSARPSTRLTVVNYGQASDKAYYDFTAAHPDVDVINADSPGDVVQAMMNQSSAIDVYWLNVNSADYDAVFSRGFMADLSGSGKIGEYVGGMYDTIKNAVTKDGKLYAMPIEMYSNSYGYNQKAFAAAGLTDEDVPKTWKEYFALLKRLPELLEEHAGISAFDPSETVYSLRGNIFSRLMNDYMIYINEDPTADKAIDTPLMRELLEAFDSVDFEALGVPVSQDQDSFSWEGDKVLFSSYASLSAYSYEDDTKPLILALDGDIPARVPMTVTVMFVNPFSAHADLATEYLEDMLPYVEPMFRIHAMPDENEPVRNSYADESLANMEEYMQSLERMLAEAEDADKADLQMQVDDMRNNIEEFKINGMYDASPESIARYRQWAQSLVVLRNYGLDANNSQEVATAISQYADGATDGATMLKTIDQKLRMMMLEGM